MFTAFNKFIAYFKIGYPGNYISVFLLMLILFLSNKLISCWG